MRTYTEAVRQESTLIVGHVSAEQAERRGVNRVWCRM
jgi:hypothetical protein